MNLGTTRLRGRPRNRWQDEAREDRRIVGGEGWQEKVHKREEWKKLLRTTRNCRILHVPMEWMNEWRVLSFSREYFRGNAIFLQHYRVSLCSPIVLWLASGYYMLNVFYSWVALSAQIMNGAILYNKFSVIFSVKHLVLDGTHKTLCFREKSTPGQPSVQRDTADIWLSYCIWMLSVEWFLGPRCISLSAVTANVPSPDRSSLE